MRRDWVASDLRSSGELEIFGETGGVWVRSRIKASASPAVQPLCRPSAKHRQLGSNGALLAYDGSAAARRCGSSSMCEWCLRC